MPHHTVQSLIKDHAEYIKRAEVDYRAYAKGGISGTEQLMLTESLEHLSIALSCYFEVSEQAQMEISDLQSELSVAESQLVGAMAIIPHSLWLANINIDEFRTWALENEIDIVYEADHFSYMTGFAFADAESFMLVKIKYGDQVLTGDIKLIC